MTSSRHNNMSTLLGPSALGLLTSVEQGELDAHLTRCPRCRDELAALTAVVGRLGDLAPAEAIGPPPRGEYTGTETVLRAVGREQAAVRRRGQRVQSMLATAACLAVLVAGVISAVALQREPTSAVPLEAVNVQAAGGVSATANLVAHTWGVEIKLAASGLAPARPYRVQVTTTAGKVVDAGAFLGTGAKRLTCSLQAAVLRADAASFAVVDPGGATVLSARF
ncbi:MAG TPA: hypothetical protein VNA30_04225 [Mycobacteriales bacterium]|nr:hypothetical protein [Mycobacteriales bacterium]